MSVSSTIDERQLIERVPSGLFIAGAWRSGQQGVFPVEDPSTGRTLCEVADGSPEDAVSALDAAVHSSAMWREFPPRERGEILRRAFEILLDRAEELALLMTLEMGKPLAESRAELTYAAEFFRWFAEEAVRIDGGYATAPSGQGRMLTIKQPVGPCLLITPWNFPLAMGTRKIGPAIAAGCTVVIKPAEQTPLSTLALAQILTEAGCPPGVVNVITTSTPVQTMAPLLADPRLRKLSFTGSTEVGRTLMVQGSRNLLRMSMELGGNAPFIVFDDADLDEAVEGALLAKMRNMGEACTAANRFYVQAGVADAFSSALAARMTEFKLGRGTESGTEVGPLIDGVQRARVAALVDDAVRRGAELVVGGQTVSGSGYFYAPTVLSGVPADAELGSTDVSVGGVSCCAAR